jgi:MFS family permease
VSATTGALKGAVSPIAEVFRLPDLRRLALANGLSQVGFWGYGVAVGVYAFGIGGAALVGIAYVARLVPSALLAPFMAALADRYNRRRVLIWTNLAQAIIIAVAAAGVAAGISPVIIFTLAATVTITVSAFEPAKNALIPELVEKPRQLSVANAAISSLESASMFIGPAIGGFALALGGVEETFIVTSLFLLAAHVLLIRIKASGELEEPEPATEGEGDEAGEAVGQPGALKSALLGFPLVLSDRSLRLVFILTGIQLVVFGMLSVLLIALAIDELGIGEAGVGWLNSAIGVGGLLGALALVKVTESRGLGAALALGMLVWGLPIAVIGLLPTVWVAVAAMVVIGLSNTVVDASTNTMLQRMIPEAMRGRVYGVLESVVVISIALGSLLAPLLLSLFGIGVALVVTGLVLPVLTLLSRPGLARIDEEFKPPLRRLELLRGIPIFAPLGPAVIEGLAHSLEPRSFKAGDEVVTQGEPGELFYIIDSGTVEVFEDGRKVREEGPGEHFGEIALLRDVARTATVTATSDLELLALERDEFLDAVTRHPLSSESAEGIVATRLGVAR